MTQFHAFRIMINCEHTKAEHTSQHSEQRRSEGGREIPFPLLMAPHVREIRANVRDGSLFSLCSIFVRSRSENRVLMSIIHFRWDFFSEKINGISPRRVILHCQRRIRFHLKGKHKRELFSGKLCVYSWIENHQITSSWASLPEAQQIV